MPAVAGRRGGQGRAAAGGGARKRLQKTSSSAEEASRRRGRGRSGGPKIAPQPRKLTPAKPKRNETGGGEERGRARQRQQPVKTQNQGGRRIRSEKRQRSRSSSTGTEAENSGTGSGEASGGNGNSHEGLSRHPTPLGERCTLHHRHPWVSSRRIWSSSVPHSIKLLLRFMFLSFDGMTADEYFFESSGASSGSEYDEEANERIAQGLASRPQPNMFRPNHRARARFSILKVRRGKYPSHDESQPSGRRLKFADVVIVTYQKCDLARAYRRVKRYGRVGLYEHKMRRTRSAWASWTKNSRTEQDLMHS